MASGIITLSSTRNVLEGRIVWSGASNGIIANSSQVTADLQIRRTDGYTNIGNWTGSLQIGSETQSFTTHASVGADWVSLKSFTITQPHNSDGTGVCYIYGVGYGPSGTSMAGHYVVGDATVGLDTIPRASTMTVSAGTINGINPTFTIDKKSDSFTSTITYVTPGTGTEVTIASGITARTYNGWTPPDTLYQYFPNSPNLALTYKLYTYSGSTLIGSAYSYTSTIYPNESDCRPTVSVTATPTDYSNLTGSATTLIKGISNVAISVTATPKNSASIINIITNGRKLSSNSTTGSYTFPAVETNTFTTTSSDSRGITSTADVKTFTMVNYVKLTISAQVARTNATSSTVKAKITGNYYDGSFGSQTNTLTLTWKWKLRSDTNYTTGGTLTATKSNGTYDTGEITLGSTFDYENDYDFLFVAADKVYTSGVSTVIPINKGLPIFDYGVDSNGNNYLNVNGTIYQNNKDISKQSTVQMYDTNQLYITISTAWSGYKIPLSNATVTGTALSFDSTNKRIVVNENGYVDFIGRLNVYLYDYVNGDYSLILRKNNSTSWQLCYKRMTQTDNYYDFVMGHAYNIAVSEGDYFELHVSCGGTGTLRTFEMLQTSLSATFRR